MTMYGYIVKAIGNSGTTWILANDGSWIESRAAECPRIEQKCSKPNLPKLFDSAIEANQFISQNLFEGPKTERVIRYDMALASIP